jgi:signal transduction histidine kinase
MAQLGASPELVALLDRVASSGEPVSAREHPIVSPGAQAESEARVYDVTLQPLLDSHDRVEAVIVFAIDMTDPIRAREEVERAREQAERANRAKDDFLAIVSHELRTPLTSILGWALLARRSSAPVDAGRAFEVIERNARAQARLVDDILDLSRIIGGKLRLNVARTELGAAIASAVDSLQPAADAKRVTLTAVIGDLGQVDADADRIQQVVWNLVSNAIKFTGAGGHVDVTAARRDASIVVRIADDGEGVEPASIPDLFRPFWQADISTTRSRGGLGLGLAIAQQIVGAHGGTIAASSAGKGRGTTMLVELPVGSPTARPTGRVRPSRPPPRGEASRLDDLCVLVVDDDEDARSLLQAVFVDRGARVTCAASAFEAIDELRRSHPDVVVSDIGMPGMDGFALMRTIRRLPRDEGGSTPAIALTAHARADDIDRALAAGFQLHAPKPIDPMALVESVASLAGRSPPSPPG